MLANDLVIGCEAHRERIIEAFDADDDGLLSEEERALAQESIDAERMARRELRRVERLESFDLDGDGELSEAEREAAREFHQVQREAERLESFDLDGDGELSEEEITAMRDTHAEETRERIRQGERPRHHPRR